jgi:hypothetical protein
MPRDYITINDDLTTATLAGDLKRAVRELRQAYDHFIYLKQSMSHMTDGTNFADVETLFGLQAGQGQIVFNLVTNAVNNNTRDCTEQMG